MADFDFYDPWQNKGLEPLEEVIKAKVVELEGGINEVLKLGLPDGGLKSFSTSSSEVKIKVTVDHRYGDEYDASDVTFGFEIGGNIYPITLESTPEDPTDEVYTQNLIDLLNTVSGDQIIATLIASSPNKEVSRRITFNRREGSINFTSKLGEINPANVTAIVSFKGVKATIKAAIYGARGSASEAIKTPLTDIVVTEGGTKNIPIPSSGLTAGSHKIEAYLLLDDNQTETLKTFSYIFVTATSTHYYVANSELVNPIQYSIQPISFNIYDNTKGLTDTLTVKFSRKLSGSTYEDIETKNPVNGTPFVLNYYVQDEQNTIRIQIINNDTVVYTTSYGFTAVPNNINWTPKANPEFYLSARNKNNISETKNIWTSGNYSVEFENVQFSDVGSGWRQNYLHLIGDARIKIKKNNQPFYPFYDETTPIEGSRGGGLLATGFTLKMRLRVPNVSDSNSKIVQAYDASTNIGFYLTGRDIFIAFKNNLISDPEEPQSTSQHNSRKFSDNVVFDLIVTGQPYYDINGNETNHIISYYVNGEIAGFLKLPATDKSLSQSNANKTQLIFGSVGSEVDIFDIRYYKSYCTPFEAIQTHAMDLDNANEVRAEYDKNNFYATDDIGEIYLSPEKAIAYGKYLAEQGKTNFAVVFSTELCNNTHAFYDVYNPNQREVNTAGGQVIEYIGSTSTTNDKDPQSFYIYRFKVDENGNGIIDPDLSLWYEALEGGALRFRRQGTSTVMATKGNVRIDNKKGIYVHTFNPDTQKFNPTGELIAANSAIWHVPNNDAIACTLLTMKKNPNDSTQARNLPTAKMYEDGARYLASVNSANPGEEPVYSYEDLLTPPQREELREIEDDYPELSKADQISKIKTRQCIDGIPSIAFEIRRISPSSNDRLDPSTITGKTNISFGGQFDLITDKSNMDVFGFTEEGTFSVEFRQNTSSLLTFHKSDMTDAGDLKLDGTKGKELLQYRYPDIKSVAGDTPIAQGGNATIGLGYGEPMQRLFDFVASCSPVEEAVGWKWVNGVKSSNNGIITIDEETVTDSVANRYIKFKTEIGHYICVNQFIYNGIMVDVALMCDQVVKNQFFTYFANSSGYDKDSSNNKLLRLLGYDFDSSWGVDNDNFFRFKHNVLWEDGLYDGDGEGDDAGRNSDFWTLMFACFADEFSAMARILRGGGFLTSNSILRYMHNNQVDVYNAIIYNINSEYSYLDETSDFGKVHGSAKEHTEWFVKNRLHFVSGKLCENGNDGSEFANDYILFNLGEKGLLDAANQFNNAITFTASTYDRSYLAIGLQGVLAEGKSVLSEIGQSTTITISGVYSGPDTRPTIYGTKFIKTITGLEKMYITQIPNWGNLTNVQELTLGYYGLVGEEGSQAYYNNPFITSLNINDNTIFPNCKKLILAGCSKITTLSLIAFPVLEEFDGRNMPLLVNFSLPLGNTIQTLHLPANLSTLNLVNKTAIEEFSIQSIKNTSVVCTGCPNVVSEGILDCLVTEEYIGSGVTLELGTSTNPVIFDEDRLEWILNIINSGSTKFSLSGYINTEDGTLRRDYITKIEDKFTNLHVLATPTEVDYSLRFVGTAQQYQANINEGGSIQIQLFSGTGVTLNDLNINVIHNIQNHTDPTIADSVIRNRFHIEISESEPTIALLTFDEPAENDSWIDAIEIKHKLNYEESYRDQSLVLTVTAVGIKSSNSSFIYQGGTDTTLGGTIDILLSIGASCTKSIKLDYSIAIPITVQYGEGYVVPSPLGVHYTAPNILPSGVTTDTITLKLKPYINADSGVVLTDTRTITIHPPRVSISIKTDGVVDTTSTIKLKNSSTGVETVLHNGDLFDSTVGATYQIISTIPEGYTGVYTLDRETLQGDTFVAENRTMYLELNMDVIPPRIVGIYSDGTLEEAEDILERGSFISGKTIVAVGFITDSLSNPFCISITPMSDLVINILSNGGNMSGPSIVSQNDKYTYYNGNIDFYALSGYYGGFGMDTIKNKRLVINDVSCSPYIGSYGEYKLLFDNLSIVNELIKIKDVYEKITVTSVRTSTCLQLGNAGSTYHYIYPTGTVSMNYSASHIICYKFLLQ